MFVHRSNRAEELVDVLAEIVSGSPPDPTVKECIVVQGRGMERWLSMELSRRLGIWANPDFPFPRRLIDRAITAVVRGDDPARGLFEPETMQWAIAALLPEHLGRPEFAPLQSYLRQDDRGARLIQLAARIADTFDHYSVYRAEMVLGWEEAGTDGDWQAVLWRALVERNGAHHIAARSRRFLAAIGSGQAPVDEFPRRVSLFGVSTLPPLYTSVLAALSRVVELHLFLLSPSNEFWGQIRSQRELNRSSHRLGRDPEADLALHLEEGNPLLASLGRLGRDFQEVLETRVNYQEMSRDLYHDPGTGNMLATLQSDILHLYRRADGAPEQPLPLDAEDRSITIHACHGAMREVEVLHDQLRAMFEADATLEPRDVVVMTPSMETYAPFIEAVFSGGREGRPSIPYRISDRSVRSTDEVIASFMQLLVTLPGRLTASEVLDLLGVEPIRRRFEITSEDLGLVRRWIEQSCIRWGEDGEHRAEWSLPAFGENSWRFGLDRLLLGYAMTGGDRHTFGGVLPYDDIEGTSAELLGRLTEFLEALFHARHALAEPKTLTQWRDTLGMVQDTMLATDEGTSVQQRRVRAVLQSLAERAERAGFSTPLQLETIRAQLERELQSHASAGGFLSGGVTFCEMVPMRSIPFRVVCLVGLNDGAFPRSRQPLGFDLIAEQPALGDRSTRDDDRYLFLEALLSARERLLITYVGQSIRDDAERPPSVIVSELLDTIKRSFRGEVRADPTSHNPDSISVARQVVLRHPLQPFSRRYFGADPDPRLFSYESARAARNLDEVFLASSPFIDAPLTDDDTDEIALDDLVRFFGNPSRFLLQRRLGLFLQQGHDPLEPREPMELNALERWGIGDRLLRPLLADAPRAQLFPAIRASGALPPGKLGECTYEDIEPAAVEIAATAKSWQGGTRRAPLEIEIPLEAGRITGVLRDLWPGGQIDARYSRVGGSFEIGVWIRHLVSLLALPGTGESVSRLVGRAEKGNGVGKLSFLEVENARDILQDLVALYRSGQRLPLPFFPRASRRYAEAMRASGDASAALRQAEQTFRGNPQGGFAGDAEDPYVRQIYGTDNPLHSPPGDNPSLTFGAIATRVYSPLLAHRAAAAE